MFIAVLLIFFLSTLTVDYIDQGRSVSVFMRVAARKVRRHDLDRTTLNLTLTQAGLRNILHTCDCFHSSCYDSLV